MVWDIMRHHEYDVMIKLVDSFINGAKTPPTPQNFREALSSEMRSKPSVKVSVDEGTNCRHCEDLGVLWLPYEGFDNLCLCDCREGKKQKWPLPTWSLSFMKFFGRRPCPIEWFKPEPKTVVAGTMDFEEARMAEINKKVNHWRTKIKLAADFWSYQRQEGTDIGSLIQQ